LRLIRALSEVLAARIEEEEGAERQKQDFVARAGAPAAALHAAN
jgi:hypothetical protein